MSLPLPELARQYRDAVRDKSYRAFPMGQEAGHYLRFKRKRLTPSSYRDYESALDKLARFYPDLELHDFEPPIGTERVEELLDIQWGEREPRTYNKNLSYIHDFFEWQVRRGRLHGDPTLTIERAKARAVYRTVFTLEQRAAILASNPDLRDRVCLRLLLDYGLRKGALRAVRFQHFDHQRRRLTVFTKGETVHRVPIPQKAFWLDLERLIQDIEAQSFHYLLPRQKTHPVRFDPGTKKAVEYRVKRFPDEPMGEHGAHDWWYRCLARAGVVPHGITRGERMHKARHSAGQHVLDASGNLKAVQKMLGHKTFQTTADQYLDWDIDQLEATLADAIEDTDA